MSIVILWFLVIIVCVVGILVLMVLFGGASEPIPVENTESEKDDDRLIDTPVRLFQARDGSALAYREYGGLLTKKTAVVVLLHGSAATSVSLDPLARYLSLHRYHVICPDVRGHGDSGIHGRIEYIGQLEDDIVDLMSEIDSDGKVFLVGFSSGGGLALRFAGSTKQFLFHAYVLLAPFISHEAATYRDEKGTTEVGMPRFIALMILNKLGVAFFNNLTVVKFLAEITDKYQPTTDYSFGLIANFRPLQDYIKNIEAVKKEMSVLVGSEDQVFHSEHFSPLFESAGKPNTVELLNGLDHEAMIYDARSHNLVLEKLNQLSNVDVDGNSK